MTRRRLVQVNAAFPIERDEELFAYVDEELRADVITAVEVRHRDGSALALRPFLAERFHVVQNMRSVAAGSAAIAVRKGGVRLARRLPVRLASRAGRKVGRRVWREVVLAGEHGPTHLIVSHSPLRATGRQPMWRRAIRARVRWLERRGRRWIVAFDANADLGGMGRLLGGHAFGHGVDGFVVSRQIEVQRAHRDVRARRQGWTDHPLIVLDVDL